jgi:Uma2 family endonuclease
MSAPVLKRLFSVDEFHQMAEAGVFHEDDRLELLNGEIVQMTPIGREHASCVARLTERFGEHCRGTAIVWVQNPLVLDDGTEFYPDIALLVRRSDFYLESHPRPGDALMVVEVPDTTLAYDRTVKLPRYARAGVREVWIVDLAGRGIEVYRQPEGGDYRERHRAGPGQSLTIAGVGDRDIAVGDLLG